MAQEVTNLLKNIKPDVNPYITELNLNNAIISIPKALASQKFLEQSNEKKELPLCRFWKRPDSLLEHCLQYITKAIIKNERDFNFKTIPKSLLDEIIERLKQASDGISTEQLLKRTEDANQYQQENYRQMLARHN